MDKNLDACLARLKLNEGGYTNDPLDPGGPTNFGITIYDFRHYVMATAIAADVRAMTWDQAVAVYVPKYWLALRCDKLEGGVDYAIFDYGVNSGVGRVGRVLRRILGMTDAASQIDDLVVEAARQQDAATMVHRIFAERLTFLRGLTTFPHFGKGWTRRCVDGEAFAQRLAENMPDIVDADIVAAAGRAVAPDRFARVRALQHDLNARGARPPLAEDGDLGPKTVWAFQSINHIGREPDGIVGPVTRSILDAALVAVAPLPAAT